MSAGNPLRRKTLAMRPWDWSFPSPPVSHREVISAQTARYSARPAQLNPEPTCPPSGSE